MTITEPSRDRVDVRTAGQRLPPGQIITQKWPVLHFGTVPTVDTGTWRFEITGAVEQPLAISWSELHALPRQETACDIHCVTRWSRYDNVFDGVSVASLLQRASPRAAARYVLVHAEHGIGAYKVDSPFRKPNPGMILQAAEEFGVDLAASVLLGDTETDIQAGTRAGVGCNLLFCPPGHKAPAHTIARAVVASHHEAGQYLT